MTTAKLAISAIRAVRPEAIIIAPALGHTMGETVLDMAFPEACLKDGLLPLIDAVSIHPMWILRWWPRVMPRFRR